MLTGKEGLNIKFKNIILLQLYIIINNIDYVN